MADHVNVPAVTPEDDPLAGVPDIFGRPGSPEESKRRLHIGDLVLTAVDRSQDDETRRNAIRHILACDPVRGVAALVEILGNAVETIEQWMGDPPGTAVAEIRRSHAAHEAADRLLDDVLGSEG